MLFQFINCPLLVLPAISNTKKIHICHSSLSNFLLITFLFTLQQQIQLPKCRLYLQKNLYTKNNIRNTVFLLSHYIYPFQFSPPYYIFIIFSHASAANSIKCTAGKIYTQIFSFLRKKSCQYHDFWAGNGFKWKFW